MDDDLQVPESHWVSAWGFFVQTADLALCLSLSQAEATVEHATPARPPARVPAGSLAGGSDCDCGRLPLSAKSTLRRAVDPAWTR